MESLPPQYDHRAAQIEAISEALQELMNEGPFIAHAAILEAIDQWYDYHQKEASQWKALKMTLGNG